MSEKPETWIDANFKTPAEKLLLAQECNECEWARGDGTDPTDHCDNGQASGCRDFPNSVDCDYTPAMTDNEPIVLCEHCKGTGIVSVVEKFGHPV